MCRALHRCGVRWCAVPLVPPVPVVHRSCLGVHPSSLRLHFTSLAAWLIMGAAQARRGVVWRQSSSWCAPSLHWLRNCSCIAMLACGADHPTLGTVTGTLLTPSLLRVVLCRQVRKSALGPHCLFIFVAPPSHEELERRLRNRGTETEEKVLQRLANATSEIAKAQVGSATDSCLVR
jgi:hypothetical protein